MTSKLNNYSKSKFLFEEENILREISESVLLREEVQNEETQVDTGIVSELVPTYDSKTFFIRDYSNLRRKKEIVFSDIFPTRGLEWRLKVYPHGSETSEDTHISIFVELFKGLQ